MGFIMFVDNEVVKNMEHGAVYDKFALASTMIDVSFKGAACSILEAKVMKDCTTCNLRHMCKKIDETVAEYIKDTTVTTESFSFGN
jgi:hypothetical protein